MAMAVHRLASMIQVDYYPGSKRWDYPVLIRLSPMGPSVHIGPTLCLFHLLETFLAYILCGG